MVDEPNQRLAGLREGDFLGFEGDEEAFQARAEAYAGGWAAAEVFDQVVVASAAADGVLCPQSGGGDFPEGFGVVVEAADEVGIDLKSRR